MTIIYTNIVLVLKSRSACTTTNIGVYDFQSSRRSNCNLYVYVQSCFLLFCTGRLIQYGCLFHFSCALFVACVCVRVVIILIFCLILSVDYMYIHIPIILLIVTGMIEYNICSYYLIHHITAGIRSLSLVYNYIANNLPLINLGIHSVVITSG